MLVCRTVGLSWRAKASLVTWTYRIGVNYLLNARRTPLEARGFTFQTLGSELLDGLATAQPPF